MITIQMGLVAVFAVCCFVAALFEMWWLCYASAAVLAIILVGPAWHYLLLLD